MEDSKASLQRIFAVTLRDRMRDAFLRFSPAERLLFWILISALVLSTSVLFNRANALFLTEVPVRGGTLVEGVMGLPRFINPLLSISDPDRDLTSLIYSGLMRATPEGTLMPDLAERYDISADGRSYTFFLRPEIFFHDGTPVTADDVVFTVMITQDPALKSPRRASWDGVIVERVDERTVRFTLPQPYAPFLENTTLGILPKHLWGNVSAEQFPFSQFNIEPVGSGSFKVSRIKRSGSGLPLSYELKSFPDYALGVPYLNTVILKFYSNEEELLRAYEGGEIAALNSVSPEHARELAKRGARIETSPLPRVFGVFFNQNQAEIFTDEAVREALALIAPRERIVEDVLGGYATRTEGPIPPGLVENGDALEEPAEDFAERMEAARRMLEADGWEPDEETGVLVRETDDGSERLSFSLSTSNAPELKEVASVLAETWKTLGAEIETRFFEVSDLNQNVIRPRRYDALLFGEIVGRELDLFSFWHSSQRNDPGLNIALYANITADKLLADARADTDQARREELYRKFEQEVARDIPAVFLYSPLFIYVVPEEINNLKLGPVTTSGERFLNIHEWYIETEHVWPFFVRGEK